MSGAPATMDIEEGAALHGDPLLGQNPSPEQTGQPGVNMSDSTVQAMNKASEVPDMSLEQAKTMSKSHRRWNCIVIAVALVAFAMALVAMVLEGTTVAIVAFIFPLFTAPAVIFQRKILNGLPTMVNVINQTRRQVNRLTVQNSRFSLENDRLEAEMKELQELDQQFYTMCQKNGTNVNEMRDLIKENGDIQKEMKKIIDAEQLHDIFGAFLRSDTNRDFKISEDELDRLVLRLKGYNVVGQEHLKDTIRMWCSKSDVAEWKKLKEENDGGTVSGIPGWLI